jgi:hypothetical protein
MRRLLAGFDRRTEPAPVEEPAESELVLTMLDVLRDERVRRRDPRWFPSGGERALERLARKRLAGGGGTIQASCERRHARSRSRIKRGSPPDLSR